jgi:hypothetical protein
MKVCEIYDEAAKTIGDRVAQYHKRLNQAKGIMEKMERLLPEGWKMEYEPIGGYLYFKKHEKSEEEEPVEDDRTLSLEFREVCRHVDRIVSPKKLSRNSEIPWNDSKVQLKGNIYLPGGLSIHVSLGNPNCEVTYRDEFVPAVAQHYRKVAVVPKHCLGLDD